MKRILFVEDDALVARIYSHKLAQADFEVLVAEDGLAAVKRLPEFKPDLVVLDLLMPRLNGVDVLKFMRRHPDVKSTRVVVFSNAFLGNLVEEAATLGIEAALIKAEATPARLIEVIREVIAAPPHSLVRSDPAVNAPSSAAGKPGSQPAPRAPGPKTSRMPAPVGRVESAAEFRERLRRDFFERTAAISSGVLRICQEFIGAADASTRLRRLEDLNRKIRFLTHMAGMAGCHRITQLSSALEALLYDLREKPDCINDSSRHTVASTVEFLADGLNRAERADEQCLSPTTVLVVDDDAVSSRALVMALGRVNLKATSVPDPFQALKRLRQNSYDVAILDINLPGMSGIALCEQMRKLPLHGKTPVIFVTKYTEFEPLARSILSAGDEIIGKPIMPIELTVKVIAHVLKHRQAMAAPAR
jgi:CheY-like chemotaxis protein